MTENYGAPMDRMISLADSFADLDDSRDEFLWANVANS
jgi:hypothetical protein